MDENLYFVGHVTGGHFIEDIGVPLPHNVITSIPADKALRSKDLWRAIGQKLILQIHSNRGNLIAESIPLPALALATPLRAPVSAQLAATEELKSRMQTVEKENDSLRDLVSEQNRKLDAILAAVEKKATVVHVAAPVPAQMTAPAPMAAPQRAPTSVVVDEGVPMFIPTTIKPEVTESKMEVTEKASERSGLSEASSQLKKLREKQKSGQ